MGIITELRNRSWIVLIFIALALVSFLLMDAFNSNKSMFTKNSNEFATINGIDISPEMYDSKYQDMVLQYLTQTRNYTNAKYGTFQLDPQTEFQLREQAWNDFVNETLVNKQLEEIGIYITAEEYSNLIYGTDPHPYIKNYYSALSQDGIFNPSLLVQYIQSVSNQEIWEQNPQAEEEYYNFVMREKLSKKDYLQSKYTNLFAKADYVPQWMAQRDYELKGRRVTFDYTDIPYTTIADSTVEISDREIKDYFEKNKNKFKQKDDSRIIDYIVWNYTPTSSDSASILADLNEDLVKIKTAKSDSTYISIHSEDPQKISSAYISKSNLYSSVLDSSIVDSIFQKPVGSLIGPYLNNGFYKSVSIRNRKNMPDSCNVRHLLVGVSETRDNATAKILADSLLNAIETGSDFGALAFQFSDDQTSGADSGRLGWSTPAVNFVKPFKDYVFETGNVGEYKIVETQFGYHIMNITEQKNRKDFVQVYFLSKIIEASTETIDSISGIANAFYETNKTPEAYDAAVASQNLVSRTSPPLNKNQQEIAGLSDTRSMITWAFNAEKNEFNIFNNMQDKIIVGYNKDVRNKGVPKFEDVEELVKNEAIREKKGEMLKQKMNDALSGESDLAVIAQKVGSTVKNSPNASLQTPYAQALGLEPKVVGVVMATEQGKQTKVIAGNRGIYVALVSSIIEPTATTDYTLNLNQLTYGLKNKLGGQNPVLNLKDKAKIVDNRFMYM